MQRMSSITNNNGRPFSPEKDMKLVEKKNVSFGGIPQRALLSASSLFRLISLKSSAKSFALSFGSIDLDVLFLDNHFKPTKR